MLKLPLKLFLINITFASNMVFGQVDQLKTIPNWFNLDFKTDKVYGISSEKAYNELLKNKKSVAVVVAILDSGIEIDHPDLKKNIWVNENEVANNGIDDDKNGYVDDINGWDFLGGKDGQDVHYDTHELTRLYIKYKEIIDKVDPLNANSVEKKNIEIFKEFKVKIEAKIAELDEQGGNFIIQFYDNFQKSKKIIQKEFNVENVSTEILDKITVISSDELRKGKKNYELLEQLQLTEERLSEAYDYFDAQLNYGLNEAYNPRDIVGDDIDNLNDTNYGNNEVEGPDASHGTHVAGIIAAIRNTENKVNGVCNNVKIMAIRMVPNGDERDKDVANAIKYAVKNGAKVINMSFGKEFSPQKEIVDEAVKYAEANDVLIIHAAGNDNKNIDEVGNYPSKVYNDGNKCKSWIEVGASTWKPGNELVANFSNYGKLVDVFAPGLDLYSSTTNNKYKEESGTSMASPVVAGAAALIRSYFPNLTAIEVKSLLLETSIKLPNLEVLKPGSQTPIKFNELSYSGGIINVYNAIESAKKMKVNN